MEEGGNHQIIQFSGLANALGQAETRRMQTTLIRWSAGFVVLTFLLGLAKPNLNAADFNTTQSRQVLGVAGAGGEAE